MKVFLSLSFGVLMWSLYPLAAASALNQMSAFELIFFVQLFAGLSACVFAALALMRKKQIHKYVEVQKNLPLNGWMIGLVSGISSACAHGFFMIALTLAHKGGVSLIYESWPIMALLLTPFLIDKKWQDISFVDLGLGFFALGGVVLIVLSDYLGSTEDNARFLDLVKMDFKTLIGYILTLTGAYMCAVLVVTKASYAKHFEKLKNNLSTIFISEMISRSLGFLVLIPVMFLMGERVRWANIDWFNTLFIGVGVFVIAGAAYTYGLLKARSPNIHIVYYFVPVMAVVWLHVAEESLLTPGIILGGAIVIGANVLVALRNQKIKKAEIAQAAE